MKNYIFNTLIGIFITILIVVVVSVFVPGNKTALAPAIPDGSSATSTDINTSNTPDTLTTAPTTIFGQKTSGDLNKDGKSDSAYIFTQSPGGSGTFFYVTAEIASGASTKASTNTSKNSVMIQTNSILLGDRIAPQNVSIVNGKIVVNYADRKVGEPMVAKPSVGVTKYFVLQNGLLVEVSANTTATTTVQKPSAPSPTKPAPTTAGAKCTAKGGTWSEQYRECGGVDSATCENIGGTFDECASPCRHDPNATACIMMCMQVCKIN